MLRKLVFGALALWAITDAALTFHDMPNWWAGVLGFFGSLLYSGLFIVLVYLAWTWIENRLRKKPATHS